MTIKLDNNDIAQQLAFDAMTSQETKVHNIPHFIVHKYEHGKPQVLQHKPSLVGRRSISIDMV